MSNYQQTTFFTPKDTLPTTSPLKTIFGAAYDVEFGNIATAINSKYDATSSNTLVVPLGSASGPAIVFSAAAQAGLYGTSTPSVNIAVSTTTVATFIASGVTINGITNLTATNLNTITSPLILLNANTGVAGGVALSLSAGAGPASTFLLIQTQTNYTGIPVTNGLTGGVQTVLSAPGTVTFSGANGAFMNVSAAGNIIVPAAASGNTLAVNGVGSATSIIGSTTTGNSNSITCFTGGGSSYAALSSIVSSVSQISVIANNSGGTVTGVPTGSVGLGSPTALALVIAVNNVARLTFGSTASAATSYNFAGSLLATSATLGANGTLPTQVAGYWNMQLNGNSYKVPYYNP